MITYRAVLGVDPGVNGGMALLRPDGAVVQTWAFNPALSEDEILGLIKVAVNALKAHGSVTCYMEKVGFIKGDGGKGAFTFGRIYGTLRAAIRTQNVNIAGVTPVMWQATLNCLSRGNKNVTKKRAQELFPGSKITHKTADALLIARYGQIVLAEALN